MKLTRGKLLETIRRKNEGWTTYQIRKIAGISVRRVNQVYSEYLEKGAIPELGKQVGRPSKPLSNEEIRIVEIAYKKYRVCASTLKKVIDRDYGTRINHNRIHRILLELGYAKPLKKTHKRKKLDQI